MYSSHSLTVNNVLNLTSKSMGEISPIFWVYVTAREKRRQGRSIKSIRNLEYQGEEARGLASEALNTGFRARARLAEITWHGRCNITRALFFPSNLGVGLGDSDAFFVAFSTFLAYVTGGCY